MVRKLKYHEQKLLKKVDFISWKAENNIREVQILRKYHIQKREDYTKWVWYVFSALHPMHWTKVKLYTQIQQTSWSCKVTSSQAEGAEPSRSIQKWVDHTVAGEAVSLQYVPLHRGHAPSLSIYDRYTLGLIPTRKSLVLCEKINASAFCRLPVCFHFSEMSNSAHLLSVVLRIFSAIVTSSYHVMYSIIVTVLVT